MAQADFSESTVQIPDSEKVATGGGLTTTCGFGQTMIREPSVAGSAALTHGADGVGDLNWSVYLPFNLPANLLLIFVFSLTDAGWFRSEHVSLLQPHE